MQAPVFRMGCEGGAQTMSMLLTMPSASRRDTRRSKSGTIPAFHLPVDLENMVIRRKCQ